MSTPAARTQGRAAPARMCSAGPRRRFLMHALAAGAGLAAQARGAWAQPQPIAKARALLMTVGDYGAQHVDLPGARADLQRAREMARWMGADASRTQELSDRALTMLTLGAALRKLAKDALADETVFIYFSGHGRQVDGQRFDSSGPCSEGLVLSSGELYLDAGIAHHIQEIGRKALQVLMLSDTCHSGGMATKSYSLTPAPGAATAEPEADARAKVYPRATQLAIGPTPPGACGYAGNKSWQADSRPEPRWLHVAASRADEVAWSTPRGSYATEAWHRVFRNARQTARTTRLEGRHLVSQAQALLRDRQRRQTITASGVAEMAWYLA